MPDNGLNLFSRIPRQAMLRVLLLFIACGASFYALSNPFSIRPSTYPLAVGDVASQDILAPRSFTFTSDVLTEQTRKETEQSVARIYLPADPGITRRQIEQLRATLNYVSAIRADTFASQDQKLVDLSSLLYVKIEKEPAELVLSLDDARWQQIQDESLRVLEQVMRSTIRDEQTEDIRRSIPSLISLSFPDSQTTLISELTTPFVIPNSLYSEEKTNAARQQARNSISPVSRSYIENESIVRRGQVITAATLETLEKFNLVRPTNRNNAFLGIAALVGLLGVFNALYLYRRRISSVSGLKNLSVITLTFLIFLYSARFIIPNRVVIPYLFPISAFGLTIATLFSAEVAMVFSLTLSVLAAYGLPNSLDLTLFYMLTSLCGILIIGKGRRISHFLYAGLAIGLSGSAIVLAYRLTDTSTDWIGVATLAGTSFFNGIASSSMTLLLQYLFSLVLGVTTSLQLMEIVRPDHPLLQLLLRTAPGTYQHSLQVANLAEQAAESIGADGLLTRVGAVYHDAGKSLNPSFFIENQVPGKLNPHDDMAPTVSAQTIIRHVLDGVVLARRYRLPPRIQDFILEHHGTLLTRYQYITALEASGNNPNAVDPEAFRYPGPRPRSRETAILMLADGCEARARSELPKDDQELRILIKKVLDYCLSQGQLDDCSLTMSDLNKITDSFVSTLRNIYHPRIQYPELVVQPSSTPTKTQPIHSIPENTPKP